MPGGRSNLLEITGDGLPSPPDPRGVSGCEPLPHVQVQLRHRRHRAKDIQRGKTLGRGKVLIEVQQHFCQNPGGRVLYRLTPPVRRADKIFNGQRQGRRDPAYIAAAVSPEMVSGVALEQRSVVHDLEGRSQSLHPFHCAA